MDLVEISFILETISWLSIRTAEASFLQKSKISPSKISLSSFVWRSSLPMWSTIVLKSG